MKKTGIIILILAAIVGSVLYFNKETSEELPINQGGDATSSMISPLGMAQMVLARASENTDVTVEAGDVTATTVISDILTNEDRYQGAYGLFQQQLGYDLETMEEFWAEMTQKGNSTTVGDWVEVLSTWYLEPATEEYIESLDGSGATPIDLPTEEDEDVVMNEPRLAGTWVWQETIMNNDDVIAPVNPGDFTITFTEEGAYGTTDCNNFSGSYDIASNEAAISFGPLMSTKMACEGSQEMAFTADLAEVSGYFLTETGSLALLLPFDSGSMIFNPVALEE
jgi:heat shock protein HslJ